MPVLVLVSIFPPMACSPTLRDVQDATASRDAPKLLQFLDAEDAALHGPAMAGLVVVGSQEQIRDVVRRTLATGDLTSCVPSSIHVDPSCAKRCAVLDALLAACQREGVLPLIRDLLLVPSAEPKNLRVLVSGLRVHCIDRLREEVAREPARIADRFVDGTRAQALVALYVDIDVPVEIKRALFLSILAIERKGLNNFDDELVLERLLETAKATSRNLESLGQATEADRCSAAATLADIAAQVRRPLPRSIASFVGVDEVGRCPSEGDRLRQAVAQRLRSVREASQKRDRIAEESVAEFAGLLALMRGALAVEGASAQTAQLEEILTTIARVERAEQLLAEVERREAGLKKDLENFREERLGFRYLRGYMVAQHDVGLYEVAPESGGRAILKTVDTRFTTQGWFELWVSKFGAEQITTKNGFVQEWPVFIEAERSTVKELEAKIAEINAVIRKARGERNEPQRQLRSLTGKLPKKFTTLIANAEAALQGRRPISANVSRAIETARREEKSSK